MLSFLEVRMFAKQVPRTLAAIMMAGVVCATQMTAQDTEPLPQILHQEVQGLHRRGEQVPLLGSEARLVVLDVAVTDAKGYPVSGLKAQDFTVREDGIPQTLSGFEEHREVDPAASKQIQAKTRLPPNTFGNQVSPIEESSSILLLIDVLDSPAVNEQMFLRQEMISYMKGVPAGTRIAIAQLDTKLHILQGFSADPTELLDAVKSPRYFPGFSPQAPPTSGCLHALQQIGLQASTEEVNAARHMCDNDPYALDNFQRQREILRLAVPQLMRYLLPISGRKSVVWFYSRHAPGESFSVGIKAMFADQTSFADEIGKAITVLTLNQIALNMVDISPVMGVSFRRKEIQELAEAGGGDAYHSNLIKPVIEQIADRAWNYYTLSYSPGNRVFDSKLRKLQVGIAEQGLHLQYRQSYYAMNDDAKRVQHSQEKTPESTLGPVQATGTDVGSLYTAMIMGTPAPKDIQFLAHITPAAVVSHASDKLSLPTDTFLEPKYRKDNYRDYKVSYQVATESLHLVPASDALYHIRLDFVAVVYDDEGNQVNSIVSRNALDVDREQYSAIQQQGVGVILTIAIPAKGSYFLRLGVHDVVADKSGALEVPVGEIKLGLSE